MKQVISFVVLMLVAFSVSATTIPADTLHVERFVFVQNGSSSGLSASQHTFMKRYYTPEECNTARNAYNAETQLNLSGRNIPVITVAKCEAINHSIYQ